MDKLPTTSKRLRISNPAGANARVLLIACAVLAAMSLVQFLAAPGNPAVAGIKAFDVTLIVVGVIGGLFAARHMGSATIPEQVSRLADSNGVMYALRHRSIYGKDNLVLKRHTWTMLLLWLVPDDRLIAMSPRVRTVVVQAARAGTKWAVAVVILVFASLYAQLQVPILPLMIVAIIYLSFYLWIIFSFRSGAENPTGVHIANEVMPGSGHPQMLFAVLENKARTLDTEGYAVWIESLKPELKVDGVENTGTFYSRVFVEEQPYPVEVDAKGRFSRIAFPAGCIGLLAAAWMIRSGLLASMTAPLQPGDGLYYLLVVAMAWLSLRSMRVAWFLESAFRFQSNISLMDIDGTFSQSRIRIGRSKLDSIESDNVAVRSDLRVGYHSAQAVTEAQSLLGPRTLVSLRATPEAGSRIALFQHEAMLFRNTGLAPLRPDLTTDASDVVKANLGIRAAAVGIEGGAPGRIPAATDPALLAPATHGPANDGMKTCPDCAESVKAAARKCRFCGHVFAN